MLRVLDICSGIGGGILGIIAADLHHILEPACFVEINPYCQGILSKWFPTVPIHDDLVTFHAKPKEYAIAIASIPCQPHSLAGSQKGSDDERDLWGECFRVLQETQPIGFILENVPGIRHSDGGNYFRRILKDLTSIGLDCEWQTLTVKSLGGVHERERVFLIAYPQSQRRNIMQPAIATKERTDQTPVTLSSPTIPKWTSTIAKFHKLDDGLSPFMARCLMTNDQLPIAKTIATRKATKEEVAPGLQAVGNSISPQVAAIAWKKLYERITTIG
jgi:DNA-cytosine methyltransferase